MRCVMRRAEGYRLQSSPGSSHHHLFFPQADKSTAAFTETSMVICSCVPKASLTFQLRSPEAAAHSTTPTATSAGQERLLVALFWLRRAAVLLLLAHTTARQNQQDTRRKPITQNRAECSCKGLLHNRVRNRSHVGAIWTGRTPERGEHECSSEQKFRHSLPAMKRQWDPATQEVAEDFSDFKKQEKLVLQASTPLYIQSHL